MQQQQQQSSAPQAPSNQALASEVIAIFGEHMPSDPADPSFQYLQGFMRLRLLLLRSTRSPSEQDVVDTILGSYSSYKSGGRSRSDIALMLARDFMFLQGTAPQVRGILRLHLFMSILLNILSSFASRLNRSSSSNNNNSPSNLFSRFRVRHRIGLTSPRSRSVCR